MSTKEHLTPEDRKQIESMLNQNMSFTKIGKTIGKSTLTASREVKARRIERNQTPKSKYNMQTEYIHAIAKPVPVKERISPEKIRMAVKSSV